MLNNLSDKFRAFTALHQHGDPMLQLQHGRWFIQTFFIHSDGSPQVRELGGAVAAWYAFMVDTHPSAIEAFETGCPAAYSTILKP